MSISRNDVGGPILAIMRFKRDFDIVDIANSTDCGLVNGVFTQDLNKTTRTARRLRFRQAYINEWYAGGVETPFGGFGQSGYGRKNGREAPWN